MKPIISVILPTYNGEKFIARAINSVLNQTFKDFELIIVDDGSTDNTAQVIKEFQKKDNRIKYIWQKNSGAPARPRNTGIKHAQGEYIAFLDHDDEWLPEKLKKQLTKFRNSECGLVGCSANIIDEKHKKKRIYSVPPFLEINSSKILEGSVPCSCSSMVVRRDVFRNIGLFDESFKSGDDWDLWIRASRKYRFLFVQTPLFNYYIHGNNVTILRGKIKYLQEVEKVVDKHRDIYLKYPKSFSKKLRKLGTAYIIEGHLKTGRNRLMKAIKVNPFSRAYINILLSFLGPGAYKKLLDVKKKIFNNS